jgi:hypothetical protein
MMEGSVPQQQQAAAPGGIKNMDTPKLLRTMRLFNISVFELFLFVIHVIVCSLVNGCAAIFVAWSNIFSGIVGLNIGTLFLAGYTR